MDKKDQVAALRDKYVVMFALFFALLAFVVIGQPTGYVVSSVETVGVGDLYVGSVPSGANVYLDGNYRAKTPLKLIAVVEGTHELRVSAPGYDDYVSTVVVSDGRTTRKSVSLTSAKYG